MAILAGGVDNLYCVCTVLTAPFHIYATVLYI